MKNYKSLLCIVLLIVCFLFITNLRTKSNDSKLNDCYGIFFNLNENFHDANFQKLPGVPNCCPRFESGNGTKYSIGIIFFEHPLSNSFIIGLRAGYYVYDAELTKDEATTIALNGEKTPGTFRHTLDANLSTIAIDAYLGYNLIDKLFINFGFNTGLYVTNRYSQKEVILNQGTFINASGNDTKLSSRNVLSGTIPNVEKFNFSLLPGLSYSLPLNKKNNLLLCPEVFYSYNLTDVVKDLEWKANSLRFGIALKYSKLPDKQIKYENNEKIDTIKIESKEITAEKFSIGKPIIDKKQNETETNIIITESMRRIDTLYYPKEFKFNVNIFAVGVDSTGKELPIPKIIIEEFISSRLQPVLNYVFFDEAKSNLDNRYIKLNSQEVNEFTENKLFNSSILESYYQILNIVGYRMKINPDAILVITGCNDGYSSEKDKLEISTKRAEAVKNYLLNVWNIEEKRLKTVSRNLPEKYSSPVNDTDKVQENRRVELYSDNYEIIKPLFLTDTIRKANPMSIRFKPEVMCEAGLKNWKISATQNNILLKTFEGNEQVLPNYDWQLESDQLSIPKYQKPVEYKLIAIDKKSVTKETELNYIKTDVLTIQNKRKSLVEDKEIDNYSLILFDFDKSEVNKNNQKIIDLINDRIKPNANIKIIGYTDRTGDDQHNKDLSNNRAKAVQNKLKIKNAVAEGLGEEKLLYNNDLPEGRFYCRTVNILVETPVK